MYIPVSLEINQNSKKPWIQAKKKNTGSTTIEIGFKVYRLDHTHTATQTIKKIEPVFSHKLHLFKIFGSNLLQIRSNAKFGRQQFVKKI